MDNLVVSNAKKCVWIAILLFFLQGVVSKGDLELLDCRDGWLSSNDSCYKPMDSFTESWDDAKALCQGQQSSLLVLQSDEERTWLMTQISKYSDSKSWWLGQSGLDASRHWKKSVMPSSYLVPLSQEPDDANGQERCAMISSRGLFRDDVCTSNATFICKAKKPTPDYDCKTTTYSGISEMTSDTCYWFNVYAKSWPEARDFCMGIAVPNGDQADLVSIENVNELLAIQTILRKYSRDGDGWWTGLNDQKQKEVYVFTDGTPYSRDVIPWLSENTIVDTGDDCWVLLSNGKATLYSCSSLLHPICKHSRIKDITAQCPPYWQRAGDSCYFIGRELMIWSDADTKCQSLGGHLLKTDRIDERRWLDTAAAFGSDGGQYWTGLNDRDDSGKYVWQDGTPADNRLISWDDSLHSASRCLIMDEDEETASLRSCASGLPTLACEYLRHGNDQCLSGWFAFETKCYYIAASSNGQRYSWVELEKACSLQTRQKDPKSTGGHEDIDVNYITIENPDQLDFVSLTLSSLNITGQKSIWLGLNSIDSSNKWVWHDAPEVSKKTISFQDFEQPDPEYHCAVIMFHGRYRTYACDAKRGYFCELEKKATPGSSGPANGLIQREGYLTILVSAFLIANHLMQLII